MKVQTVNVICYADNTILSVDGYTDDESGNKEAEELFKETIKDHASFNQYEVADDEIECALDDGRFDKKGWEIYLTHTS